MSGGAFSECALSGEGRCQTLSRRLQRRAPYSPSRRRELSHQRRWRWFRAAASRRIQTPGRAQPARSQVRLRSPRSAQRHHRHRAAAYRATAGRFGFAYRARFARVAASADSGRAGADQQSACGDLLARAAGPQRPYPRDPSRRARRHLAQCRPAVGTYVAGLYYARRQGTNFALVDIASVEILRGPQGTCSAATQLAACSTSRRARRATISPDRLMPLYQCRLCQRSRQSCTPLGLAGSRLDSEWLGLLNTRVASRLSSRP